MADETGTERQLRLLGAIKKLMDEVTQTPSFDAGADTGEVLAREGEALAAVKGCAVCSRSGKQRL